MASQVGIPGVRAGRLGWEGEQCTRGSWHPGRASLGSGSRRPRQGSAAPGAAVDTQESWGLAERELAKRPAEDAEALKSRRTRDRRLHAGMAQWRVEASAIADPHEAGGARWRPSGPAHGTPVRQGEPAGVPAVPAHGLTGAAFPCRPCRSSSKQGPGESCRVLQFAAW